MNEIMPKYICTAGPSLKSKDIIRQMYEEGMYCVRFNMSYRLDYYDEIVKYIHELNEEEKLDIKLMLDLCGPGLRVSVKEKLSVTPGQIVTIGKDIFIDRVNYSYLSIGDKLSHRYFFADSGAITAALDWNLITDKKMKSLVDKQLKEAEVIFVCDNNIDFKKDKLRGSKKKSQILNDKIIKYLNEENVPYIILSGSIEERYKTIRQVLKKYQ